MNKDFIGALSQMETEKGLSKDILIEAIEAALVSAYRKNFGKASNVQVHIDDSGDVKVIAQKMVVEDVEDPLWEIALIEARSLRPTSKLGDEIEIEVTPKNFGRIAAQTAKQVVVQRLREAEREMIFDEYKDRQGDVVTGVIQRKDGKNIYVDLGRVEAILTSQEQIPNESYRLKDRIKSYIVDVKMTTKGPVISVSRTHPGLLRRLFELEVPEIFDGVVQIKGVAREAGYRSKIAVSSTDKNVDPVGSCVGPRGARVQTIVSELRGEKIDIIRWDEDPSIFVANALNPAKVISVSIEAGKTATVVVPDNQLSLAIGKAGQNARLAAKLTGWRVDIRSEKEQKEIISQEWGIDSPEENTEDEEVESKVEKPIEKTKGGGGDIG